MKFGAHNEKIAAKSAISYIAFFLCLFCLLGTAGSCRKEHHKNTGHKFVIVTSDTILSGMASRLVPSEEFTVSAILPPDQCPGHYDIKLSEIRALNNADLLLFFEDMPIGKQMSQIKTRKAAVSTHGNNWMAPGTYLEGLDDVAHALSLAFPEYSKDINSNKNKYRQEIIKVRDSLLKDLSKAGASHVSVIGSAMQKQNLEWMGFDVLCSYGRPESFSPHTVQDCINQGLENDAVLVADNLQSGPDAGAGIAGSLNLPHVVLRNFPTEKGYSETLKQNAALVISALEKAHVPDSR